MQRNPIQGQSGPGCFIATSGTLLSLLDSLRSESGSVLSSSRKTQSQVFAQHPWWSSVGEVWWEGRGRRLFPKGHCWRLQVSVSLAPAASPRRLRSPDTTVGICGGSQAVCGNRPWLKSRELWFLIPAVCPSWSPLFLQILRVLGEMIPRALGSFSQMSLSLQLPDFLILPSVHIADESEGSQHSLCTAFLILVTSFLLCLRACQSPCWVGSVLKAGVLFIEFLCPICNVGTLISPVPLTCEIHLSLLSSLTCTSVPCLERLHPHQPPSLLSSSLPPPRTNLKVIV